MSFIRMELGIFHCNCTKNCSKLPNTYNLLYKSYSIRWLVVNNASTGNSTFTIITKTKSEHLDWIEMFSKEKLYLKWKKYTVNRKRHVQTLIISFLLDNEFLIKLTGSNDRNRDKKGHANRIDQHIYSKTIFSNQTFEYTVRKQKNYDGIVLKKWKNFVISFLQIWKEDLNDSISTTSNYLL